MLRSPLDHTVLQPVQTPLPCHVRPKRGTHKLFWSVWNNHSEEYGNAKTIFKYLKGKRIQNFCFMPKWVLAAWAHISFTDSFLHLARNYFKAKEHFTLLKICQGNGKKSPSSPAWSGKDRKLCFQFWKRMHNPYPNRQGNTCLEEAKQSRSLGR